jgi:hypothetical protein
VCRCCNKRAGIAHAIEVGRRAGMQRRREAEQRTGHSFLLPPLGSSCPIYNICVILLLRLANKRVKDCACATCERDGERTPRRRSICVVHQGQECSKDRPCRRCLSVTAPFGLHAFGDSTGDRGRDLYRESVRDTGGRWA